MTWHPELQQLVFSPLAEAAALRVSPAVVGSGSEPDVFEVGGSTARRPAVGTWAGQAAQQAEILASFPLQAPPPLSSSAASAGQAGAGQAALTTFGVEVLGLLEVFVEYVHSPDAGGGEVLGVSGSWEVRVGIRPIAASSGGGTRVERYMPATDLDGGDYNKNSTTGRHL